MAEKIEFVTLACEHGVMRLRADKVEAERAQCAALREPVRPAAVLRAHTYKRVGALL